MDSVTANVTSPRTQNKGFVSDPAGVTNLTQWWGLRGHNIRRAMLVVV
jgi:hypothetical protein